MKRCQRWLGTAMAIGVMAVPVTMAAPAQAQTTANGPYYATPSWDQTLPAATRFIVLSNFGNDAVLDRNTGLVWERTVSQELLQWTQAGSNCITKVVFGQSGWRLPSVVELTSLMDWSGTALPQLPLGHPFLIPPATTSGYLLWSATQDALTPARAWIVNLDRTAVRTRDKTIDGWAWCVRGGVTADAY